MRRGKERGGERKNINVVLEIPLLILQTRRGIWCPGVFAKAYEEKLPEVWILGIQCKGLPHGAMGTKEPQSGMANCAGGAK